MGRKRRGRKRKKKVRKKSWEAGGINQLTASVWNKVRIMGRRKEKREDELST